MTKKRRNKKRYFSIVFFLLLGCNKTTIIENYPEFDINQMNTLSKDKTGVTFYLNNDCNEGQINVTINGDQKVIESYFPSGTPQCGQQGTAFFELVPGKYGFKTESSKRIYKDSILIEKDICTKKLLPCSEGLKKPGAVTFYTASNWGDTYVTINSQTKKNTTSFGSNIANCYDFGTAWFDSLAEGQYHYTTSNNWSGNITITAGECLIKRLD